MPFRLMPFRLNNDSIKCKFIYETNQFSHLFGSETLLDLGPAPPRGGITPNFFIQKKISIHIDTNFSNIVL